MPFTIDEGHPSCHSDINFDITGFALKGKVTGAQIASCAAPQGGPSGITLTLSNSQNHQSVASQSATDGSFEFSDVFPGIYSLTASHPEFTITPASQVFLCSFFVQPSIAVPVVSLLQVVKVEWGSLLLSPASFFQVVGYNLTGSVHADHQPVRDVSLFLYPVDVTGKLLHLHQPIDCTHVTNQTVPLDHPIPECVATSDAQGRFTFRGIPCGLYSVVPFYHRSSSSSSSADASASTSSLYFDVLPEKLSVSVLHGEPLFSPLLFHIHPHCFCFFPESAQLSQSFDVLGFSCVGRVVVGEKPIRAARIIVNGREKTRTDAAGTYRLERITTGTYSIEASAPHYVFRPLKDIHLSPSISVLPDITPTMFDNCGKVDPPADEEGEVHIVNIISDSARHSM